MIAEDKILEVRERSSIVEVISDHVSLRKTGRNYLGLCPFHAEKTPSFTVNEEKGIFHCFGCGVGGNVFHFLMQQDHLTFPESVERVAKRYGIAIQQESRPAARRHGEERESLYHLNERAADYFHRLLFERAEGKRALEYLKKRGIEESLARRFLLGFASAGVQGLVGFLRTEGLPLKTAVQLGLVGERGPGKYTERFFDRVIFPIATPAGKIVGFGGRVIGEGLPKYLNSAESPLFHKGSNLYGLSYAKDTIRALDRVVVVEGYMDVLSLFQHGISYAVATLGTALTREHVRLLARYTKNIVALFDGDVAGRKAAARSFEIFVEEGLFGMAAFLPKGTDPDSFIRARGKQALEAILERAIPLADYYLRWLEWKNGNSLAGKSETAKEIRRLLDKLRNPVEADLLVRRAVDSLGIREETLRRSLGSSGGLVRPVAAAGGSSSFSREAREDFAERSLVSLFLSVPSLLAHSEAEELETLFSPKWAGFVRKIIAEEKERGNVDAARLLRELPPAQASQIAALMLEGGHASAAECETMMADCLLHLRRRHLRDLEKHLRQGIRVAEERRDEKAKRERMLEWQEVVRKERQLGRQKVVPKSEIPSR
ncbi:MAG: DNA primase [Deltaproteobacteria bacterium]|nr:DNA primase [Deltaproteobacteria bacterium]